MIKLGIVLITLGIFFIINKYWAQIPNWLKTGTTLYSMILLYGLGFYLKERFKFKDTGHTLILLAILLYGIAIFNISKIFNIYLYRSDGFILWMLGIILMSYALDSYRYFYLAIFIGFYALFGYIDQVTVKIVTTDFFISSSSIFLLFATIITFITAIFLKKRDFQEFTKFH